MFVRTGAKSDCLRILALLLLASAVALLVGSCDAWRAAPPDRVIRVWCHRGDAAENRAIRQIALAFNVAHSGRGIRVAMVFFPEAEYPARLAEALEGDSPPDAFSLDGRLIAHHAKTGRLTPLDPWFDRNELEDFLPTVRAQGTVAGRLYALTAFESGVALYYDRAMLAKADVVPPPDGRSWSWPQFLDACEQLKRAGLAPLALPLDESDDAVATAFTPVIWSGGGELISTEDGEAAGVLSAPENVASLAAWQELFRRGYAVSEGSRADLFAEGLVAMEWNSQKKARALLVRKGEDLGVMLLPRLGGRPVAPCGSWAWGVSARARDRELASLWIKWATDLRHGVEPLVRATGAVPSRRSAFTLFPEYTRPPLHLFRDQLELVGRPRSPTPHPEILAAGVAAALRDIAGGAAVADRLRTAEKEIDHAIRRAQTADTLAE